MADTLTGIPVDKLLLELHLKPWTPKPRPSQNLDWNTKPTSYSVFLRRGAPRFLD